VDTGRPGWRPAPRARSPPRWSSALRAAAFAKGPSEVFQFHLAEHDDFVSPAALAGLRRALRAAGRRSEAWVYPGTRHGFFEADREALVRRA